MTAPIEKKAYSKPVVESMDVTETRLTTGPGGEFVQPGQTATGAPS